MRRRLRALVRAQFIEFTRDSVQQLTEAFVRDCRNRKERTSVLLSPFTQSFKPLRFIKRVNLCRDYELSPFCQTRIVRLCWFQELLYRILQLRGSPATTVWTPRS